MGHGAAPPVRAASFCLLFRDSGLAMAANPPRVPGGAPRAAPAACRHIASRYSPRQQMEASRSRNRCSFCSGNAFVSLCSALDQPQRRGAASLFVIRIHDGGVQPRAVGDGVFSFLSFFLPFSPPFLLNLYFNFSLFFFFFSFFSPRKGVGTRDAFAAGGWCCVIHDVIVLIKRLSAGQRCPALRNVM